MIGGRVRVRVAFENGASGLLYVAITRRLLPGTLPLPPEWDIQLLAAFFPGVPLEDIDYIDEIAGHNLKPDEVSYCGLVLRDGVASPPDTDSGTRALRRASCQGIVQSLQHPSGCPLRGTGRLTG